MLPLAARLVPIPAPIILNVPQKKESPIPASGPIKAAFTALIDSSSTSSPLSLAFLNFSSMAIAAPAIKLTTAGVVLKIAKCLFKAYEISFLFLYNFFNAGIIM